MIYNRVMKTRMTIDAFDDDAGNSCYRNVTIDRCRKREANFS